MADSIQGQTWRQVKLGLHTLEASRGDKIVLLVICRPSGCTVASSIVSIGVCNRCQMRTSKCTCLIFGVSMGLDPGRNAQKECLIGQS